ncbi:MAG TPA: hypothetical protein VN231_05925 [Allosphingosinicella sp.]|nr:hypothetical protein [Allosphingosinicella sp.]
MAEAFAFSGANKVYAAPSGRDDVSDLHTFSNGKAIVSAWRLTPEELAEVNRSGGVIFLSVLSGNVLYPVFVGSEEAVRSVVADYGPIWKREVQAGASPSDVHNRLSPGLLSTIVRSVDTEDNAFVILESLTLGVLLFYGRGAEHLEVLTERVTERLAERRTKERG